MSFDKEETRNLLNMLRSPDVDNHVIAFESINNADLKNYIVKIVKPTKNQKLWLHHV